MKNALLWKRILNEGIRSVESCGIGIVEAIIKSPIIVDLRPISEISHDWADMPSFAFPFERFWMELQILPGVYGGVFVTTQELPNGDGEGAIFACIIGEKSGPTLCGQSSFRHDKNRVLVGMPSTAPNPLIQHDELMGNVTALLTYATCDTLQFLSCKNVSLSPRDNDPKQVRRAVKRHGGKPEDYRYHVLVVRPPGASHDSPGQEIGIMPRHICRGHFAEYGAEFNKGLLFGRYSGRFYIPPHLKGQLEHGIVEKDYAIKPLVIVPDAQPGREGETVMRRG
jgi:hypothetical protein